MCVSRSSCASASTGCATASPPPAWGQATRAHLIAATLLLRGPRTGEDARKLMADLRAEAFRRAIAAEESTALRD